MLPNVVVVIQLHTVDSAAEHGVVPSTEHLARHPYALQTLAEARFGAVLTARFLIDTFQNVTITDIPVAGHYLVRALHRNTPAAAAAAQAVKLAALRLGERDVETGRYPRDIVVKRLVDPSEQP
jgi:hypothetical protein